MQEWQTVKMKVSDLKPADYNPRSISDRALEGLSNSIERFGVVQPIVWNKKTGNIVGGHQRYKVLVEKGIEDVDVVVVDLDEKEEVALNVALNNPAIQGEFDEKIADILKGVHDVSLDLFESLRMDDLAESLRLSLGVKGKTDDNHVPETPKVAISETGKMYSLGNHRLICGDSTSEVVFKKLMGLRRADMMLTDPPYGVAYTGGTKDAMTIANDDLEEAEFIKFLSSAFSAANTVMREGSVFYIWYAGEKSFEFFSACRSVGWKIRQSLIWLKDRLVLGRKDYHYKHEPCMYGWKNCGENYPCDKAVYEPEHEVGLYGWKEGKHLWTSNRKQTTILEFDRPSENIDHPTMKPVALFEYLIWNNSRRGGSILDPFSGSGTAFIAAEKSERVAFGIELSPNFCDVIRRRWAEFVYGEGCEWAKLTPEVVK